MIERDDLNVIDIMVPIELNYRITEAITNKTANKKIAIICEKPLAPDLQQANAARDIARKNNIPIMIAENYRYNQEYNIIRDLVRTKHIGDIYYFLKNHADDFPTKMIKDNFKAKEWRQLVKKRSYLWTSLIFINPPTGKIFRLKQHECTEQF